MNDEIERIDPYTICINGYRVRATLDQEERIRAMDTDARTRFVRAMGGK